MNIQEYLNQWKTIQVSLLQFIDTEDNKEDEFNKLIKILSNFGIASKKPELKLFLHLLCQISRYHHRLPDFFDKIEQIIKYYAKDISMAINKTELFHVFKNSPKVLLFLYNQQMVTINQASNRVYFYHEKLQNSTKEEKKWILENINESYIENNEEKRQKGENDLYICELIRNDSVNDFIIYVNKNAINLKSQIYPSYYETHSFLSEKEPSLIEYAVFFGSIQIFNYLKVNNVPLTPSLWYYAIHSNSDVMIHTLINDDVKPLDDNYGALYKEAIKCHHNETANFIGDYFLKDKDEFESNHFQSFVKFYNFSFINENLINNKELFGLLCCTDYISLVDHFLNTFKDIDVNAIIILGLCFLIEFFLLF